MKRERSTRIGLWSGIATFITIFVFFTGMNYPEVYKWAEDVFKVINNNNSDHDTVLTDTAEEDDDSIINDNSMFDEPFHLTGSIVHSPSFQNNDFIIGGVWRLQHIKSSAYPSIATVEIYAASEPEKKYFGHITFNSAWCESSEGGWGEIVEKKESGDYLFGTYGTFVIDVSPLKALEEKYIVVLRLTYFDLPYTLALEVL